MAYVEIGRIDRVERALLFAVSMTALSRPKKAKKSTSLATKKPKRAAKAATTKASPKKPVRAPKRRASTTTSRARKAK